MRLPLIISALGVSLALLGGSACAQTATKRDAQKPTSRARVQGNSEPAAAPTPPPVAVPVPATGPSGVGSLKLGMTREAIMALGLDEPVRVVGELTPAESKTPPPPGVERFRATITLPLANQSAKSTLSFKDGVLQAIGIDGSDDLLEALARQVANRYGPGTIKDERKDEQCIYRNGNSFTLKSGMVSTVWSTPLDGDKTAETQFLDIEISTCPSNLRYGSVAPIKLKAFEIVLKDNKLPQSPTKSLF
jgi:hypothetical protein